MKAMAEHGRTADAARLRLVRSNEPTDPALVDGLRADERWARDLFFERYAASVERTLRRILGRDRHGELADLIHEAFAQALDSLADLRDPQALPAWMRAIAARTAYRAIRRRTARRWLSFFEPSELPHPPSRDAEPEVREAYVRTYALLDRLSARERVAFVLRYVEGLPLAEVADACEVSLATVKRTLSRAEGHFLAAARRDPVLREWLEEGGRWAI